MSYAVAGTKGHERQTGSFLPQMDTDEHGSNRADLIGFLLPEVAERTAKAFNH